MTSFRNIVDDNLRHLVLFPTSVNTDVIVMALRELADEMDRRYPKNLVAGDITEEMIDSLNNYPGFLVPKKDR